MNSRRCGKKRTLFLGTRAKTLAASRRGIYLWWDDQDVFVFVDVTQDEIRTQRMPLSQATQALRAIIKKLRRHAAC
jgi:hypothetical protein